jgi:hypothetical protein
MGFVDWAKDSAAQAVINKALAGIGSVEKLAIDRTAKSITGRLTLQGETTAIAITVNGYELGTGPDGDRWRIASVSAERPWLAELGARWLVKRWFPLPPSVPRRQLEMVL